MWRPLDRIPHPQEIRKPQWSQNKRIGGWLVMEQGKSHYSLVSLTHTSQQTQAIHNSTGTSWEWHKNQVDKGHAQWSRQTPSRHWLHLGNQHMIFYSQEQVPPILKSRLLMHGMQHHIQITVVGNKLKYNWPIYNPILYLTASKLHLKGVLSTSGSKYLVVYI